MVCRRFLFFIAIVFAFGGGLIFRAAEAHAVLEADEVLVIANLLAADSILLAKFYLEKRGIPRENLLIVRTSSAETCSRKEYNQKIAAPVRKYLEQRTKEDRRRPIRCLLLMYGMPLKVAPGPVTAKEKLCQLELRQKQAEVEKKLVTLPEKSAERKRLRAELQQLRDDLAVQSHSRELAALDSELSLVMAGDYTLAGWLPNPSYLGYRGKEIKKMPTIAYMVARLDGPTPKIVKRLVLDSLAAEKTGLTGTACFDARWPRPDPEKVRELQGYGLYDNYIHLASDLVAEKSNLKVVLNDKAELFQPGDCPDAVLYCGWYRLSHYLDAFDWRPGTVGYHIASGECTTLKQEDNQGWCLGMLRDGVAAVIGPVAEPYVQAFPPPSLFFSLLLDGRFSLAECFALSVPFRSWRLVLVGDPLYRPFVPRQ
ncbi:MAG: TIGR03790 family protein [Pseudomonadota bacterium]|nr:TIGR03790 family protein [Pseudomonadota bacterium]